MLPRIRRSALEASSLISPFGRMQRRIAASRSLKSATDAVRAASSGNFVASSRNCCRSHAAVSSNDPASRKSAASNTAAGDSSRSIERRPGAHVVLSRNNSRSLSNSRTSSARRAIRSSTLQWFSARVGASAPTSSDQVDRASAPEEFLTPLFSIFHFLFSACQLLCQKSHCLFHRFSAVHQLPIRLPPNPRSFPNCLPKFHFSNPRQYWLPELAQHYTRFRFHHRFIQHLPNHGQFHQRSRAALARYKRIPEFNQSKQPFFPSLLPHLHINPFVCLAPKKFRGHAVCFPAGLLRSTRHRLHHPAVRAAAYRKTASRQRLPQRSSLLIIRITSCRPRASEHGHDSLVHRLRPFVASLLHCFITSFFSSNSSIIAWHNPSSASCTS